MVEQDATTARRARASGGRPVVTGDACEPSVLDRVGLDTVGTVVAATGDDEDNLVVSLLVKRWYGVPRVVAGSTTPRTPGCSRTSGGRHRRVRPGRDDLAAGTPSGSRTWSPCSGPSGAAESPGRADPGRGRPAPGPPPGRLDLPTGAVVAVVRGDQVLALADASPFEEARRRGPRPHHPPGRARPAPPPRRPARRLPHPSGLTGPPAVHCHLETGCSAAARHVRDVEAPGSNPGIPTTTEPPDLALHFRLGWSVRLC